MRGHVYVLTNPSMPGLVKIGRTKNRPQERANDLFTTGVPTPFVVHCSVYTKDCIGLESKAHKTFASHRVSGRREFFQIDPEAVCEMLKENQYPVKHRIWNSVRSGCWGVVWKAIVLIVAGVLIGIIASMFI